MEAKLCIRVGTVELNCEGSEDFVKNQFPIVLDALDKLQRIAAKDPIDEEVPANDLAAKKHAAKVSTQTIASVAAKLGGGSGTDLILSAAAKLSLIDGADDFSRETLITEIKKATGFYKASYSSNFTNYLTGLVKSQKLLEVSDGKYALPQEAKLDFEKKLA